MYIFPKRVMEPYNWIGHIPFVYELVRVMRPECIVELGTHTGNSFVAMCESVFDSKLASRVFAVDTWEGEKHAGRYSEKVHGELARYTDQHFSFATLLRMTFDEALASFEDQSVDLLHIDGLHTYAAVKHDYETWLPKMKDGSVILFHDTNERRNDFGVYKLWDELKRAYAEDCFEFTHNHGLGVILIDTSGKLGELRVWLKENVHVNSLFHVCGEWLWYKYAYDDLERTLHATRNSRAFRLGKTLLTPFRRIIKR